MSVSGFVVVEVVLPVADVVVVDRLDDRAVAVVARRGPGCRATTGRWAVAVVGAHEGVEVDLSMGCVGPGC